MPRHVFVVTTPRLHSRQLTGPLDRWFYEELGANYGGFLDEYFNMWFHGRWLTINQSTLGTRVTENGFQWVYKMVGNEWHVGPTPFIERVADAPSAMHSMAEERIRRLDMLGASARVQMIKANAAHVTTAAKGAMLDGDVILYEARDLRAQALGYLAMFSYFDQTGIFESLRQLSWSTSAIPIPDWIMPRFEEHLDRYVHLKSVFHGAPVVYFEDVMRGDLDTVRATGWSIAWRPGPPTGMLPDPTPEIFDDPPRVEAWLASLREKYW
jgi:hypothetical protein